MKALITHKKALFYLLLISAATGLAIFSINNLKASEIPKLTIVYPVANSLINPQDNNCFIIGQVEPADTKLNINGTDVEVSEDGAFVHYGSFIVSDSNTGVFEVRMVSGGITFLKKLKYEIPKPLTTSPGNILEIDITYKSEPETDQTMRPGEVINVSFKGTPGCEAYFTIEGINQKIPMAETSVYKNYLPENAFGSGFIKEPQKISGIYKGHLILPKIDINNAEIKFHLMNESLGKITKSSGKKLSVNNSAIASVIKLTDSDNFIIGRTGHGLGYKLLLNAGTKLIAEGTSGDWIKCRISNEQHVFIPKQNAVYLPAGTPPPKSIVRVIRTRNNSGFVTIEAGLTENLPYEIKESIDGKNIKVRIYGATSDIDWIYFDTRQTLIKNITWDQISDDILELNIDLNQKQLWGYFSEYVNNVFTLSIKKPPEISSRFLFWGSSLKNRKIVLDPGHNPEWGAVGARGTKEKDVNLAISLKLKQLLEDKGAIVFLTHTNEALPLTSRRKEVIKYSPDISVSIHNNAVPDGVNPIKHNGSSVYFYNPNARKLATSIHKKLLEQLNLPDFGLYWDNLYMCRIPETISVLVEPAFMIIPEQEKMLREDEGQMKIAKAIAEGIEEFFDNSKE